jgi:hypothetical protein
VQNASAKLWIRLTRDALRWEQAYSADGGKTWETHWIMSFTRVSAPPAPAPAP